MGSTMSDPIGECVDRARAVPELLRSLKGEPDAGEHAQRVCDELIADLDVLLLRTTAAIKRGAELEPLAEQIVQLKWMVYCVLRRFLTDCGWSGRALLAFEHSARVDLRDSRARLRMACIPELVPTVRIRRAVA